MVWWRPVRLILWGPTHCTQRKVSGREQAQNSSAERFPHMEQRVFPDAILLLSLRTTKPRRSDWVWLRLLLAVKLILRGHFNDNALFNTSLSWEMKIMQILSRSFNYYIKILYEYPSSLFRLIKRGRRVCFLCMSPLGAMHITHVPVSQCCFLSNSYLSAVSSVHSHLYLPDSKLFFSQLQCLASSTNRNCELYQAKIQSNTPKTFDFSKIENLWLISDTLLVPLVYEWPDLWLLLEVVYNYLV